MKSRRRIPQEHRVRAILQQEIGSACPICQGLDVGHFHIHHIDEDPGNNELLNLLLVCPTCHSKITKGEIEQQEVRYIKRNVRSINRGIEVASMAIDSIRCSWAPDRVAPYAFFKVESRRCPFPILSLTCINHTQSIVVFTAIHLKAKYLSAGLSGLPHPEVVRSVASYTLPIPIASDGQWFALNDPIGIPSQHPFKFDIALYEIEGNQTSVPTEPMMLHVTLQFNALAVEVSPIFLNCRTEKMESRMLVTME